MQLFLICALSLLLAYLVIKDWQNRSIPIWSILVLVVLILANSLMQTTSTQLLLSFAINLGLLLTQLALLQLYFMVKNRRWVNLSTYLGLGDVLFFVALAMAMSPLLFCWTMFGSLLFTLLAWGLLYAFKIKITLIPLLSGVGLFYIVFFWVTWWKDINLYSY